MDGEPIPREGLGEKLLLALGASVLFLFATYITSIIISEALGRRGLPGSPLLYAVASYPLALLVALFEERVKVSKYGKYFDPYWYIGVFFIGSGIPIILTIFVPLLFWRSLPPGGAVGVVIAAEVAIVLAILTLGFAARRRNNL